MRTTNQIRVFILANFYYPKLYSKFLYRVHLDCFFFNLTRVKSTNSQPVETSYFGLFGVCLCYSIVKVLPQGKGAKLPKFGILEKAIPNLGISTAIFPAEVHSTTTNSQCQPLFLNFFKNFLENCPFLQKNLILSSFRQKIFLKNHLLHAEMSLSRPRQGHFSSLAPSQRK